MFYVYVLLSERDSKLYIGYCNDLKQRIKKHLNGFVSSTKNRRPLKLVYYEAYKEGSDAKRREKYLKGGNGHAGLKIQLQDCFNKLDYRFS